jgi:hypothetical protein
MKAIIVGGEIMGLATAGALARDGHEVELLEQGPLPSPLASSTDEHRLIRHPCGDHRGYARMIDDAYAPGTCCGTISASVSARPPGRSPSRATARPGQRVQLRR